MKQILKSYFYWTYGRGSFHYDVMVTLILAFIFITPLALGLRGQAAQHRGQYPAGAGDGRRRTRADRHHAGFGCERSRRALPMR